MRFKVACIVFVFVTSFLQSFAQPKGKTPEVEEGDEHFKHGNYIMALPIYRDIFKVDPKNKKVEYKLALCYLNTN